MSNLYIRYPAPATSSGGGGGSGTVTQVNTGAGLTGGPVTTSGTISVASVSLSNQVVGNLAVTNLNTGSAASSLTFWRGDGNWALPTATVSGSISLTSQVSGVLPAANAPIINRAAEVIPGDSAWAGTITFTGANATFDQGSFTATANKFTALRTGIHMITISGGFGTGAAATNSFRFYVMKNETTASANSELAFQAPQLADGSAKAYCTAARMFNMVPGDYIAFEADSSNGMTFTNMRLQFTEIGVK